LYARRAPRKKRNEGIKRCEKDLKRHEEKFDKTINVTKEVLLQM
jgi:hypothetical protein